MFYFSKRIGRDTSWTFLSGRHVPLLARKDNRAIYFFEDGSPDGASFDIFVFDRDDIVCDSNSFITNKKFRSHTGVEQNVYSLCRSDGTRVSCSHFFLQIYRPDGVKRNHNIFCFSIFSVVVGANSNNGESAAARSLLLQL